MDVSPISTSTIPLTIPEPTDAGSTDASAQATSGSFPSVLQASTGSGSSDIAMLQALQQNAGTSSSTSTKTLAADAATMMAQNSNASLLQALGYGSNSSVLNLLQSIYDINAQTNATIVQNALSNAQAGTSATDPAAQDTVLQSLLTPPPAADDSTDPVESLITSGDGTDGSTDATTSDPILDSLLQPGTGSTDSTDPTLSSSSGSIDSTDPILSSILAGDASTGTDSTDAVLQSLLQPDTSTASSPPDDTTSASQGTVAG